MKLLFFGMLVFSILLFGCVSKTDSKTEVAPEETKVADVVEKPKTEVVPEVMKKEEVKTDEKTLGTGKQAIKESEIPEYDKSADKKLEDLINKVK